MDVGLQTVARLYCIDNEVPADGNALSRSIPIVISWNSKQFPARYTLGYKGMLRFSKKSVSQSMEESDVEREHVLKSKNNS